MALSCYLAVINMKVTDLARVRMRGKKTLVPSLSGRVRKRAQEERRHATGVQPHDGERREARWEKLFQGHADAVVFLNAGTPGSIVECSGAVRDTLGFEPEELIGKTLDCLISGDGAPEEFETELARASRGRGTSRLDGFRFLNKDGEPVEVEIDAMPFRYGDDTASGLLCFVRRAYREEVAKGVPRVKYSFQSAVVEDAAEGLCIGHSTKEFPYTRYTVWNKQMTAITGYSIEEINRYGWCRAMHTDEAGRECARERIRRIRSGEELRAEECEITRSDGEKRILSVSTASVQTSDGDMHTLTLMHDITEKRQAEALFKIQRDLAVALASTNDLEKACGLLLDAILKIDPIDSGAVYLVDGKSGELNIIAHRGLPEQFLERIALYSADSPMAQLVARGEPAYWADPLRSSRQETASGEERIRALAVIPVTLEGQVVASLNLSSHSALDIHPRARSGVEAIAAQIGGMVMRVQAMEALRERETMFRELAENIREVFWVGAQGEMIYISPAFEDVWGFSRESLYSDPTSFMDLIHPDDRDRVLASYQQQRVHAEFDEEYRLVRPDGQVRWVWTRSFPIWKDGRVERRVGISEDITGRKLAEERLRNSRNTLGAVFDAISDALLLVDGRMRVVMLNKAASALYNMTEGDVISYGRPCYTSLMGRKQPCEGCEISSLIQKGDRTGFERRDFRRPGSIEQITIFPIRGEGGETGSIVIHVRDVTEAKRIERELIHADKMISLGVLVSGVAHEINNPNSFIMLNTPLLHEAWESVIPILEKYYEENGDFGVGGLPYSEMREEVVKLFMGLLEGSRRIDRIVQELKRFSRQEPIDADEIVHIDDVVRNACSLVSNMIRKSTDVFSVHYGANLPVIRGSAQKLEHVVVNLIRNACQALPDRNRTIRVSSNYDASSGCVAIEVRDEGVGIPEEILPRIMDPFFTTKQSRGGTGLGLSVCANIVHEHGGTIDVESRRGEGTTVTVSLPTNKRPSRLPKILAASGDGARRGAIVRILTENRRYIVHEASSGVEACIKLGASPPDLLVYDLEMRDMNGLEIFRAMERNPDLSGTGMILMGDILGSSEWELLARKGLVSVVSEPEPAGELLEAVARVLSGGRMRKP